MADDRDLLPALLPLWVASLAVLLHAARAGEPLGAQATLALFFVLAVPLVLIRGRVKEV